MSAPIFFSDLDHTLIYSNKHIQEHHLSVAGMLTTEQYEHKPLSFIHLDAWKSLVNHAGTDYLFVPTTTRTLRQYRRVLLPDVEVGAAIVLNGAKILINGVEDYDWTKHVAQSVKQLNIHPVRLWEQVTKGLKNDPEVTKIVSADDYFIYVVTKTDHSPHVDAYTAEIALETGYKRSKQGRKTYLIPPTITKGNAVAEIKQRFNASTTFAAGDSVLDFSMISEVNHFIFPKHGDLTSKSDAMHHTEHASIEAGKDITTYVETLLNLQR